MKFCPECNNLLYYLESNDTIYLECNNCGHKEENDKNVLLTKLYKSDAEFSMSSNINYKYDPTLPRTIHRPCPNKDCKSKKDKSLQEAVYLTDKVTLQQLFICCECNTEWKYTN